MCLFLGLCHLRAITRTRIQYYFKDITLTGIPRKTYGKTLYRRTHVARINHCKVLRTVLKSLLDWPRTVLYRS